MGGRTLHHAARVSVHRLDGPMIEPVGDRAAEYRDVRRQIEEAVQSFATSIDGRRFDLQAPLHGLELAIGGYVVLETGSATYLGQVLTLELGHLESAEFTVSVDGPQGGIRAPVPVRAARGTGVILDRHARPFLDARLRPADHAAIGSWLDASRSGNAELGIGTLSLPLGRLGVRLHGVESHAAAVADARANAEANGLKDLSFDAADAGRAMQALPEGFTPTVLLVDPPRKGLDPAFIKSLEAKPVPEIVYVSCDPANLARDVKALGLLGYRLRVSQGVDLFPQTAHVESVNHLVHQGA